MIPTAYKVEILLYRQPVRRSGTPVNKSDSTCTSLTHCSMGKGSAVDGSPVSNLKRASTHKAIRRNAFRRELKGIYTWKVQRDAGDLPFKQFKLPLSISRMIEEKFAYCNRTSSFRLSNRGVMACHSTFSPRKNESY